MKFENNRLNSLVGFNKAQNDRLFYILLLSIIVSISAVQNIKDDEQAP
jgi:hypothetical protein